MEVRFPPIVAWLAILLAGPPASAFAQEAPRPPADEDFYPQRLNFPIGGGNILIKAPGGVRPAALLAARKVLSAMTRTMDPGAARRLGASGLEIAVIPEFRRMIHLPEFRHLAGKKTPTGEPVDNVRGITLLTARGRPVIAAGEENLLRLTSTAQSTLHHEFGHAVHFVGLTSAQREQWTKLYAEARRKGLFGRRYGTTSENEYFAELTEAYFDVSPLFCTRRQLAAIDPAAYKLLDGVFSAPGPDAGPTPEAPRGPR